MNADSVETLREQSGMLRSSETQYWEGINITLEGSQLAVESKLF